MTIETSEAERLRLLRELPAWAEIEAEDYTPQCGECARCRRHTSGQHLASLRQNAPQKKSVAQP